MNKKTVIIWLTAIVIIIAILAVLVIVLNNKVINNISCDAESGKCVFETKNGFGYTFFSKSFTKNDLMQCNLETIFAKAEDGRNMPQAYELYIHLQNGNDIFKIKTLDKDNLSNVCTNILQNKSFSYKFVNIE